MIAAFSPTLKGEIHGEAAEVLAVRVVNGLTNFLVVVNSAHPGSPPKWVAMEEVHLGAY